MLYEVITLQFNLPGEAILTLEWSLLLGTPILSLLGSYNFV